MPIIPPGFQTVSPYIFCDDAASLAAFLAQAFGARERGRTEVAGRIANLQLQIGTVTLMLAESDERYAARPSAFYLYVDDAEVAVKRALEVGATLEMQVMDMPYDDRQGGVVDPAGNIWWISQRLVDAPYHD